MLIVNDAAASVPLSLLTDADLSRWLSEQSSDNATWVRANAWQAERHRVLVLPAAGGGVGGAIVGLGPLASAADLKLWHAAGLADRLPPYKYRLATPLPAA